MYIFMKCQHTKLLQFVHNSAAGHKLTGYWVLTTTTAYQISMWTAQGWEFAHRFSEQIARFLQKNERMSDLLKATSDLLIRSFLVRGLSSEQFAHIAHFW